MASEPQVPATPSAPSAQFALELKGLRKTFGACVANSNVTFSVARGSIHALVGENGAGKSTAVKMLYGIYPPDQGEIIVHGARRRWRSPKEAKAAGIGMVHQHFMLAEPLSALDNIVLGDEPSGAGTRFLPRFLRPIDRKRARAELSALVAANHFQIDLDAPAGSLPVGVQQRAEILKLLYRDADILILDEPTAVLTPSEVDELFVNLRKLRDGGKTIIIITHKLREVLALCDQVTVIRKGETVKTLATAETTEQELADLMVGRAVALKVAVPPLQLTPGARPGLALQKVTMAVRKGRPVLSDLSFAVAPGEVVGIAGVEGNGQSDLLQLLIEPRRFFRSGRGKMHADGVLTMLGTDVRNASAAAVRQLGVGIVPEDRHKEGLLLGASVAWNYLLGHQRAHARAGVIRWGDNRRATEAAIAEFDVRPPLPDAPIGGFSGGNQQKVVIAREFRRQPSLLIFAQPTRGVDVGSIEFIHSRIIAARSAGHAVLLISSSLEEILALSDRILVMYEGRINGSFVRGACTEGEIGRLMGGGS